MSTKFQDNKKDEWNLVLSVGMLEDIKEATDVDIDLIIEKPEKLAELFLATPKKLVQVLYVICEDQIVEKGLTVEVTNPETGKVIIEPDARAFGKRFDRDTLDKAADSLIEAIVNFYPRSSAGRVIAGKLPALLAEMDKRVSEKAEQVMNEKQKELLNTATS